MTKAGIAWLVSLGALWSVAGGTLAAELSVARLQRLLQEGSPAEVRFTELRESRWLAVPIESSGTMRSSAAMLEKRVERPRKETWRILGDRMQVSTPDSGGIKEFMLDTAPAAAALARTLRQVMAGDLDALNKDFLLELSGEEGDWGVRLTPRKPEVGRQLKEIALQGAGRRLSTIVIVESQGDRTTTRLQYPQ